MSRLMPRLSTRPRARSHTTIRQRLERLHTVARTHAAMFGYMSVARAALSRLVQPKDGREGFDAALGVDTSEASVIHSQIPSEWIAEAIRYEPVNVGVLRHVFSSLPFRHEDYHLVDLGCGKGRTLMVGAEYPF